MAFLMWFFGHQRAEVAELVDALGSGFAYGKRELSVCALRGWKSIQGGHEAAFFISPIESNFSDEKACDSCQCQLKGNQQKGITVTSAEIENESPQKCPCPCPHVVEHGEKAVNGSHKS